MLQWYENTQVVYSTEHQGSVVILRAQVRGCIHLHPPAAVIAADVEARWGDQAPSEDYYDERQESSPPTPEKACSRCPGGASSCAPFCYGPNKHQRFSGRKCPRGIIFALCCGKCPGHIPGVPMARV